MKAEDYIRNLNAYNNVSYTSIEEHNIGRNINLNNVNIDSNNILTGQANKVLTLPSTGNALNLVSKFSDPTAYLVNGESNNPFIQNAWSNSN